MIRVRLFGKFGDLVDSGSELLIPLAGISTVDGVIQALADSFPALHREITSPQVLVAVNQHIVSAGTPVTDGDEVAFLPPVTGG